MPEHPIVHQYVSTACQHTLHEECRSMCKWCAEFCLCRCHRTFSEQAETLQIDGNVCE